VCEEQAVLAIKVLSGIKKKRRRRRRSEEQAVLADFKVQILCTPHTHTHTHTHTHIHIHTHTHTHTHTHNIDIDIDILLYIVNALWHLLVFSSEGLAQDRTA
jgi:ABC-type Zn2+ transport system substrate-binding protein/surface adhesin